MMKLYMYYINLLRLALYLDILHQHLVHGYSDEDLSVSLWHNPGEMTVLIHTPVSLEILVQFQFQNLYYV